MTRPSRDVDATPSPGAGAAEAGGSSVEWERRYRLLADAKRRQSAVVSAITRIFEQAMTCETEEDLGRACLAVVEDVTASRFGFIGKINPRTHRLDDLAISDPGWEACQMKFPSRHGSRVPVGFEIRGIYGRVLRDGKGFFTNDPESHPDRIGTP
jgi:two-component system CheB/CheR fusion protein